jgi:chitinase
MAYFMPRGDDFDPDTLQLDKLTHIIFSFTEVEDNQMKFRNEARGSLLEKLSAQKAKYPDLKVMVACGGWGGSGGFSEMAATEETRRQFVESVGHFIKEYNLDGLDIDWEYPGLPGAGNPHSPKDKENFTALMHDLRKEMDRIGRDQVLTFAAAGWQRFFDHIEVDKVMQDADYMNLMTYDLAGGGDGFTSHHTNLGKVKIEDIEGSTAAEFMRTASDTSRPWSAEEIVDYCIGLGVDPGQLVIGAAFYGKGWIGVPPENNGLYQKNRGAWNGFGRYLAIRESYEDKNGFARHWDPVAKAPWLYNPTDSIMITYDDTVSVRLKAEYVRRGKLGGIMFWELSGDTPGGGLLHAIHSEITGVK